MGRKVVPAGLALTLACELSPTRIAIPTQPCGAVMVTAEVSAFPPALPVTR
jgi:hypothetical protein